MRNPASQTANPASPLSVRRAALSALAAIACAGVILLAAYFSWRMAVEEPGLRKEYMVACMVAGVGATSCLAGAMHFLNKALQAGATKWYVRWPLKISKRCLLVAELATTGLAIAAAGILIFGFRIPGTTPH